MHLRPFVATIGFHTLLLAQNGDLLTRVVGLEFYSWTGVDGEGWPVPEGGEEAAVLVLVQVAHVGEDRQEQRERENLQRQFLWFDKKK